MKKKCDLEPLVSIKDTPQFPLHQLPARSSEFIRLNGLCPYYTMFPLDFPFKQLIKAKPGDWVFDPFCGRGTTNFAARLHGLPSVGIDSNPVAAAVAAAKLVNVYPKDISNECETILTDDFEPEIIPQGRFWDLCFHPLTLNQICKLREELLNDCSTDTRIALRALLLGILHGPLRKGLPAYLSNQMPRTYGTKPNSAIRFWEKKQLYPNKIDVAEVVVRKAHYTFAHLPPASGGTVFQADSRDSIDKLIQARFKWVITSPPYYGMSSYFPDQWLRNWFMGGECIVNYKHDRQISHTSELKFIDGLSHVWKRTAEVCVPGAHLIIRFGALPSLACNPTLLLKESLKKADCGWKVKRTINAGHAAHGKRQSEQFKQNIGNALDEIDIHAVLE
jgi:hypothetical protein